jgi:hypothetical protein
MQGIDFFKQKLATYSTVFISIHLFNAAYKKCNSQRLILHFLQHT